MTVVLRPVAESDLQALYEQQADPASVRMAAVAPRERDDCFAHWRTSLADPTVMARAIDVDGECAGHVVSFLRDGVEPREVGYWIARSHWGRGVATHNPGSRRVLEKCGFTLTETQTDPKGDGVDEWRFRLD